MRSISSRDNPQYKELKRLATNAAARSISGSTVLDGVHLCAAYLNQVGAPLLCAVGTGSVRDPEVSAIVADCEARSVTCVVLPDGLYRALSQVEHGVALLFVIAVPQALAPDRLAGAAVLLDRLQDPGNLGSILRSTAAAGIQTVYCSAGTASAWSPKVLRAGMGAHFLLNIFEDADLAAVVRNAQVPVLATSSHAAHLLYDVDLRQPLAWIFGNEGSGIAPELLGMASQRVTIPHRAAVESLNVSACAAICLFEQVRQQAI
jgi:RNA methyltransferase, TrmH family